MDRFKRAVDWASMQNGLPAEAASSRPGGSDLAPRGTTQLDAFTEGEGLTGSPPPALAFEDPDSPALFDSQMDEEDRLLSERLDDWPEEDYLFDNADTAPKPPREGRHSAALELAPAPTAQTTPVVEPVPEPTSTENATEAADESKQEALARVRILASMEDPILGPDGEEIVLSAGDVHMLTPDVAEILVASGVAESANL